MLISTTVALFAAASRFEEVAQGNEHLFLIGAGVAYGILAGYYYFMLTQNYAAMVGFLRINRDIVEKFSDLWGFFKPRRVSVGSFWHQALLFPAAAVPLTTVLLALCGLRLVLKDGHGAWFWIPAGSHVVLFFVMMWLRFRKFVHALRELTAQQAQPLRGAALARD